MNGLTEIWGISVDYYNNITVTEQRMWMTQKEAEEEKLRIIQDTDHYGNYYSVNVYRYLIDLSGIRNAKI